MSSDGKTVAVGAWGSDANGSNSGAARVYSWDEASFSWSQIGADLVGDAATDQFGYSVSLSSDGNTLAVGNPQNDGNGVDSGYVRVYRWNDTNALWSQLGSTLSGEAAGDKAAWSLSLSSDGNTVAIGAFLNDGVQTVDSGHVRVFKWDDINSIWSQLGDDINGEYAGDASGRSVSMSKDGKSVAIGGRLNDGNGSDSGHVRVYKWSETNAKWSQIGRDIDGEAAGDQSGYSVSLSGDGSSVAISAPYNDGNGASSGHVRVFKLFQMPSYGPTLLPSENPSVRCLNKRALLPLHVELLTCP
jgi:hypothetical protein